MRGDDVSGPSPSLFRAMPIALALLTGGCATAPKRAPAVPVFDVHAHLEPSGARGKIHPGVPGTAKELLTQMRRADVLRALAISVADRPEDVEAANAEVLAAVRAHPGHLVAVGTIALGSDAALPTLDRLAQAGFRAVKLSPREGELSSPQTIAVVQRAAELHLVVMLDGWSIQPDELGKLALAAPAARLLVAHLGGVHFQNVLLLKLLARYTFYSRNVWFDLSSIAPLFVDSPYRDQLVWTCRQLGTDRILFGSDFPLVDERHAVEAVRALGFSEQELRQILGENAAALFPPAQATSRR